ncbi:proline dehydrogenase [Alkalihalobacterium chitinilyticum]|uniref:proline dehydrogenase n=1 Tax=Alkalihalobacterium chitinilyticum TaxID=2980103 RepID=A0ABT5VHF9_9BACI|nr:proline dehydrogenase [Alkalihalobacterium chitinilyticum]MDE5414890.1 proline dehydrogenase [Alkalihalobacterium chitinilyticum]
MMHVILRNFFLFLSKNQILNRGARKWGLKLGASQVVAGETISKAMNAVRGLNEKGLVCTVDHLGEFVKTEEEAAVSTEYCIRTLNAIAKTGVNCNLSLKLTQLGLDVEPQLCYENMKAILSTAKKHDIFVRIDMEDYSHCQQTIDILEKLRREYDGLVGTAIQAYLYRAIDDVKKLKGVNLRLVKGAYRELPEVAFQKKDEIDDNYLKIIKQHLRSGSYTAVATHDHQIIEKVKDFCREEKIAKTQFEFQMLYGFRTDLQEQIAKEGYTMRIYVPYGKDWYGYFMRRLAERPQNVSFALRGFFSK